METQPIFNILTFHKAGLFSNFNAVLAKLEKYDNNHSIPIVWWGKYCYEPKGILNAYFQEEYGENVWEYYFEPVSKYKFDASLKELGTVRFVTDPKRTRLCNSRLYLKNANYLIRKYIKIKPHITDKVNSFYDQYMKGHHVLGIHLRGTDKSKDPNSQFCSPTANSYIKQINKYLKKHPDSLIYIASDSDITLNEVKMLFLNKVVYYDSLRSKNNTDCIHNLLDKGSPYKKGEDIIIESLLLSKCDFLIRSISNVSIATLSFNPNLKQINIAQLYYNNYVEAFIAQTYLDGKDMVLGIMNYIFRKCCHKTINFLKKVKRCLSNIFNL